LRLVGETAKEAGMALDILPLGDSALVVRTADSLADVLKTADKLRAASIAGVEEIVPAFASVGIFFQSGRDLVDASEAIRAALRRRSLGRLSAQRPRVVEIPVCYEDEFALDLPEVAQHCGLQRDDVVKRHAAGRYQVRCVGFTPGFPYLAGLPKQLVMPRRRTPRTSVVPGSVAIGGRQTGIYPLASPGGWNIIGRTPLRLFDPAREPAALLRAGDRVRFVAITAKQFAQWRA
jgi:inhibitor of KinA